MTRSRQLHDGAYLRFDPILAERVGGVYRALLVALIAFRARFCAPEDGLRWVSITYRDIAKWVHGSENTLRSHMRYLAADGVLVIRGPSLDDCYTSNSYAVSKSRLAELSPCSPMLHDLDFDPSAETEGDHPEKTEGASPQNQRRPPSNSAGNNRDNCCYNSFHNLGYKGCQQQRLDAETCDDFRGRSVVDGA